MTMDSSYLTYPHRSHGQDHDLYDWRYTRPALAWPKGRLAVSLVVSLEFFPLDPSGVPFKHPGAMATPYPDLRHYTVRDYGNRVGVFRLLDALDAAGVKAGFAVQGRVAERYPPLLDAVREAGHEVIAHGVSTDHIHHEGLSEAEEVKFIARTKLALPDATGWLSPARNESFRTPRLLAEAGYAYTLDWEMDSQPVRMETEAGDLAAVPLTYELSDFTLLHMRRQSEDVWVRQLLEAVDYLAAERPGNSLAFRLTPYLAGQPFRIHAVRELLSELTSREDVWLATPGEVASSFEEQA